jgi:hypothetical protein
MVSQSDVLQAPAIATAVQVATAGAAEEIGQELNLRLLDLDLRPGIQPEKNAIDA